MPTKKNAAPVEDAPIRGHRRTSRYREVTLDLDDEEGEDEPLRVTIRMNLTFEQINAIPSGQRVLFQDIFVAIAPYVTAWNVVRTNHETGRDELVPPPAEAGPDVLLALDPVEALWLAGMVRQGYLGTGDDRKKGTPRSGSSPGPASDGASA